MPLDEAELAAFTTTGVIIRRGGVPIDLVDRARALVTAWYRTEMDQSHLVDYTQRTFAPDLGSHPDVLALFTHSGVSDLVCRLIGDFTPVTTTQIQIRVPEAELQHGQRDKAMHVDGVACEQCLEPVDDLEGRTLPIILTVLKQGRRANAGREGTTRAHRSSWSR